MAILMTNFDAIIKKYMKRLAWEFDVRALHKSDRNEVLQLHISWGPNCDLPEKIIIKQPKSCLRNYVEMHNNECNFYELKRDCGWSFAPTYYGSEKVLSWKDKGTIMLEDLTVEFEKPNFVEGLALQQTVRVVDALAKIHATCIVEPEIMAHFTAHSEPDEIPNESIIFMQKGFPELFPQDLENVIESTKKETAFDVPEVLVHGDISHKNLFYPLVDGNDSDKENQTIDSPILDKFEDLKSSSRVALIDWAHVRKGLFTEDLADLLTSNLPPNVRRKYTALLLKHYYAQVVKTAKSFDAEVPYTLTDVIRAYDGIFPIFALKTAHRVATHIKEDKAGTLNQKSKLTLAHRAAAAATDARVLCHA